MSRLLLIMFISSLYSCLSYRATLPSEQSSLLNELEYEGQSADESQLNYARTLYPLLRANCVKCHDPDGDQLLPGPSFVQKNPILSHESIIESGKINYFDLTKSPIYRQVSEGHQQGAWVWTDIEVAKTEVLNALKSWKPFMDKEKLLPSGIMSEEFLLSSGEDIQKTVSVDDEDVIALGKRVTISLNSIQLVGVDITLDFYENPLDHEFYTVENLQITTSSNPIALQGIKVHLNQVLSRNNHEFNFISDVIEANTTKKLSVQDMNKPARNSIDVIGYIRVDRGLNGDSVMLTFDKISVYD